MPVTSALALALSLLAGQATLTYPGRTVGPVGTAATSSVQKVCVIGNSLAVGAPYAPTPVMTRLLQYLGASSWTLDNKAVGGTRADVIRDSYFTYFQGKGCTWVSVEGGTNTVVDGTAGIGTTAWNQIKTASDAALADNSNVLLHTIPPRSSGPGYSAGVQQGVDDFNTATRAYAAANPTRVKLVDLYILMGEPGTPAKLRTSAPSYDAGDGLHHTQAAQDVWACEDKKAITNTASCS